MPPPTTIYARERGSAPSGGGRGPEARVVYMDVPIVPNDPLHVGQKARVLSLIPCDELFLSEEETRARYYTARDIGVWGTVVRMRVEEEGVVEFILENDNIKSSITHVYLTAPREEGRTVRTPLWRRWLGGVAARPAKATRTIEIEDDVTVFENKTTLTFTALGSVERETR
ncbi:hypothetical protein OH77DRAFT_1420822 [Trametes cingulata]|nr:hypothetical protein OH77DRAFT_1420822 [Trametes cingulata]